MLFIDTGAPANDLLELGHGLDALVEHNEFTGLGIHARAHQLGGGGNDGIAAFRKDKIIQLFFAFLVIAGNTHHIAVVFSHQIRVCIDQGLAHALGVIDVFTKNNGLVEAVAGFKKLGDLVGYPLGALFQHQGAVKITLVVNAVLNECVVFIDHAFAGSPASQVFIQINTHHLVRSQKAVINALAQGVGVNGLTKVVDIGHRVGFLGRGRQANLGRRMKIFQNFPPGRIFSSTATMTFVNDDQVKKIRTELRVDVLLFFAASYGLI